MDGAFFKMVEHMAELLASATRVRGTLSSLEVFRRALPFTSHYVRVMEDGTDQELGMIPTNALPSDLGCPVRSAILADVYDDRTAANIAYHALALQDAPLRALRGLRVPFVSPHHCRLSMAVLEYCGVYESNWWLVSYHPRERRWLSWSPHVPAHYDAELEWRVRCLIGAQFSARYDWHAILALREGAPSIAIPCEPAVARKLFCERDVPLGASRRAALRHWVSEHYRARRDAPPSHVREHLRGVSDFDWRGMVCHLEPSAYDRERARAAL